MAISVERNRKVYTADGNEKTFQYDFRIFVDSDLTVLTIDPATQIETTKTLDIDYTVSNAGVETGGNVVFTNAPTAGHYIVLWGTYNFKQETDFEDGDSFPAVSVENGLDKCTCQNIRQFDEISRALKMSVAYTGDSLYLPFPAAGKILGWNDDADEIVHYDNPKVYSDAAAASALESADYASDSLDNSNTALAHSITASGHSDVAQEHAHEAIASATTASGYAVDASTYANLARDWASSSGIVADGFESARTYALLAYQTVYSGVEPAFAPGTKMWFYQSTPPDGWNLVADVGDRLLSTATYSGAAGGNTAGSWTFAGFSSNSTGAHTHTMGNHIHTQPTHTHAGVDHLHTTAGHTHTYDHYHAIGTHGHTANSHAHSVGYGTTSVAAVAPEASYTTAVSYVNNTSSETVSINSSATLNTGWSSAVGYSTTSSTAPTTNGADRSLTSGAGGNDNTGAPTNNTSDSGGAHSHTISHNGTDRPAACVGIIAIFVGEGEPT